LLVDVNPSTTAVEDLHEGISRCASSPRGHPGRAVCSACSPLGQGQQFRMRDDVRARLVYGLAAPSMKTASRWRRTATFSITSAYLPSPHFHGFWVKRSFMTTCVPILLAEVITAADSNSWWVEKVG